MNEFLRQIEQFKGIFIAATNHFTHLDAALMRRFAFRLGFKPLTLSQRVTMLTEVCGGFISNIPTDIASIQRLNWLTAGDIANVKRRLTAMAEPLNLCNFLREFETEALSKHGAEKQTMGFLG